jgi:hypothetical protein
MAWAANVWKPPTPPHDANELSQMVFMFSRTHNTSIPRKKKETEKKIVK